RREFYTITKLKRRPDRRGRLRYSEEFKVGGIPCPPCNVGPRSTPSYENLAAQAVKVLGNGNKVFAGQRAESFFVDLGSVFDLGTLRRFQDMHLIRTPPGAGVDGIEKGTAHSIGAQG